MLQTADQQESGGVSKPLRERYTDDADRIADLGLSKIAGPSKRPDNIPLSGSIAAAVSDRKLPSIAAAIPKSRRTYDGRN
jgi:hypothetical protein